ncbi:uncharacterized protein ARB_00385 [Trichophyton benhamiae CBS 112371]|uniref:Uncharacterized protein n=1 Tax=Arthroderma benhamiae (strain ATCC MYA-4681 / CBS 112371) TaxID=663331 RepID=D4AW21_ARTBC|nr:uncharacterized protein ARB_00385 [Trichophyton benhamiae CBS 112371]EFE32561.1 hypothetical protein ARB_00385 [Trichophyton benhamiae CBS 112371]
MGVTVRGRPQACQVTPKSSLHYATLAVFLLLLLLDDTSSSSTATPGILVFFFFFHFVCLLISFCLAFYLLYHLFQYNILYVCLLYQVFQFEKDAVQPTQENTTNQRKREREREREKREESVSLADILGESPVVLRLRVYLCLRGVLCCLLLDSSLISVPSCCLFLSCYFITLLSVVRLILQSKEKDQSIKKKVDSKRKTKRQETKPSSCSAFSSLFSALVLLFFLRPKFTTQAKSHNQHQQPPLQLKLPAKEKKESNRKSRKTRRSGTNHHYLEL